MAADPCAYHLFLTRIPPRLPKEEVEAALAAELESRDVGTKHISIVPQSAWKNKGFGFITLSGSPEPAAVAAFAAQLDGQLSVGGRALSVRVCAPSTTVTAPTPPAPSAWDQPPEKIRRLCAQVLHCFFARRPNQTVFKAEKLVTLLSMTIAPSRGDEPKPIALWGHEMHGSLEQMLLAIGDSHFGAGWSLEGAVADRTALLTVGKARSMQGWDSLRDPLPIATLLRLAACKSRLEGTLSPGASSGFSTPSASGQASSCRRVSDCGSLSNMHSSDQPSCSQSEASWSLRSLRLPTLSSGEQTRGTDTCANGTPGTASSDEPTTSTTSPASYASYHCLHSCVDDGGGCGRRRAPEPEPPPGASQRPAAAAAPAGPGAAAPAAGPGAGAAAEAVAGLASASEPLPTGVPLSRSKLSQASTSGRKACSEPPSAPAEGHQRRRSVQLPQQRCVSTQTLPEAHHRSVGQAHDRAQTLWPSASSPCLADGTAAPASRASSSSSASATPPPTARDLLYRCAQHLHLLFRWHPAQPAFPVPYVAEYLSAAPNVVSWGADSPYFSLEGYASAVYGSLEGLLMQVSRSFFGGALCIESGRTPTDNTRYLCLSRSSYQHAAHGHQHHHHHHHAPAHQHQHHHHHAPPPHLATQPPPPQQPPSQQPQHITMRAVACQAPAGMQPIAIALQPVATVTAMLPIAVVPAEAPLAVPAATPIAVAVAAPAPGGTPAPGGSARRPSGSRQPSTKALRSVSVPSMP